MPGWAEVVYRRCTCPPTRRGTQVGRYWWGLVRDQLDAQRRAEEDGGEAAEGRGPQGRRRKVVAAIYDFVVTNTRYVALEFGIHGYKPYRVDRVLARRFGDCKDKASLIVAMLKVAGVDARPGAVAHAQPGRPVDASRRRSRRSTTPSPTCRRSTCTSTAPPSSTAAASCPRPTAWPTCWSSSPTARATSSSRPRRSPSDNLDHADARRDAEARRLGRRRPGSIDVQRPGRRRSSAAPTRRRPPARPTFEQRGRSPSPGCRRRR